MAMLGWMLVRVAEEETKHNNNTLNARGRILGAREKSILEMKYNTLNAVKQSNGQIQNRATKNKELCMTDQQLETTIRQLMDMQENKCALTGIDFEYRGEGTDSRLYPSLDRIDSAAHYEKGNLQVVCRFINFWKSDMDNNEFKCLLRMVRGIED